MVTDFGAALQEGIERLRVHASSAMVDTIFVDRVSGRVMDPVSLQMVNERVSVYDGPGKVRRAGLQDADASAGDRDVDLHTRLIDLPFDTTGIELGDRVTVTAAVQSPGLQGWSFTVTAVAPRPFEVTLTVKRVVQDDDA